MSIRWKMSKKKPQSPGNQPFGAKKGINAKQSQKL